MDKDIREKSEAQSLRDERYMQDLEFCRETKTLCVKCGFISKKVPWPICPKCGGVKGVINYNGQIQVIAIAFVMVLFFAYCILMLLYWGMHQEGIFDFVLFATVITVSYVAYEVFRMNKRKMRDRLQALREWKERFGEVGE